MNSYDDYEEFDCDHCGYPVVVRGVKEREWVHTHGSVFCMVTTAAVNGSIRPPE